MIFGLVHILNFLWCHQGSISRGRLNRYMSIVSKRHTVVINLRTEIAFLLLKVYWYKR